MGSRRGGKTNVQIADMLCISPKTLDNHRTRMVASSACTGGKLVRFAAKHKLLS
jgi:DNA-binding NarL/FixJ family response regulator